MMENDPFYSVGLELAEKEDEQFYKNVRIPNDMITMKNDTKDDVNKDVEYTEDGRRKDVFSVIFKPDPKYPNPDVTGNGVATSLENLTQNDCENAFYNIECSFNMIKERAKSILDLIPPKSNLAHKVIFKNLVANGSTVIAHYDYHKIIKMSDNEMVKLIIGFFKGISRINFGKPVEIIGNSNVVDTLYKNYEEDKLHTIGGIEHALNQDQPNLIKLIWNDTYDKAVEEIEEFARIIYKFCINFNTEKVFSKVSQNFSRYFNLYNDENKKKSVVKLLAFMVTVSKNIETILNNVSSDYKFINATTVPAKNLKIIKKGLITSVEKINPWIGSDYHLLKEYITSDGSDVSRTENIIKMHNSVVKPDDVFLFLGDLSESEFFDHNHKKVQEMIIQYCKQLNGKKIIITGNNDTCDDSFLKKCGFIEIYRNPIITERHVFSHGPIETDRMMNIHGHIHGTKSYWGIDYYNHFDVFHELWGKPVKLSFIDKIPNQEAYYNGCKSEMDKPRDPESQKIPENYIE